MWYNPFFEAVKQAVLNMEAKFQKDGTSIAELFVMVLVLVLWFAMTAALSMEPMSVAVVLPALAFVLFMGARAEWKKRRRRRNRK